MKPDHATIIDYDQITDNVFIGNNMCCQVHFEEELLEKGITADLSLEEERVDSPFGVDFYMWLPTKDHFPPSRDQIDCGVSFLEKILKKNRKIYIHCKNGHGRAPTIFASYLILKEKMKASEAMNLIKNKRPGAHLHKPQADMLKSLEKQAKA